MSRLTVPRELLTKSPDELVGLACRARDEWNAATDALHKLAGEVTIGEVVDAYERQTAAARRLAQILAALCVRRASRGVRHAA